jgi:predicted small metal-binding protein
MASFKCKDIGMKCNFEVKADTADELLPAIKAHAAQKHGINDIPADLKEKIDKAIKK